MIYLTSDHHFGHNNIIKYCNRPYANTHFMDKEFIKSWNSVVKPEDTVFYVGDFSLNKNPEYITSILEQLNGSKHLILGNHDALKPFQYVECGFISVHTSYKLGDVVLAHDPSIGVALPKGSVLIHGHVHGLWTDRMTDTGVKLINVSVDAREYKPVLLEALLG